MPVLTRDLPVGTRRFREDIQRERGLSAEEADQLLQGFERSEILDPFLETRGEELAVGIERAAAFLQSASRSAGGISRLWLTGGGGRIPGLNKVLGGPAAAAGRTGQPAGPAARRRRGVLHDGHGRDLPVADAPDRPGAAHRRVSPLPGVRHS